MFRESDLFSSRGTYCRHIRGLKWFKASIQKSRVKNRITSKIPATALCETFPSPIFPTHNHFGRGFAAWWWENAFPVGPQRCRKETSPGANWNDFANISDDNTHQARFQRGCLGVVRVGRKRECVKEFWNFVSNFIDFKFKFGLKLPKVKSKIYCKTCCEKIHSSTTKKVCRSR